VRTCPLLAAVVQQVTCHPLQFAADTAALLTSCFSWMLGIHAALVCCILQGPCPITCCTLQICSYNCMRMPFASCSME
jgi:hypothetical protein